MQIYINDLEIEATNVQESTITKDQKNYRVLHIDFQVKSEDYHEVTTEFYKNDFLVKVPEKNLEFPATIYNYSTSITNLYIEGEVGDFKIELIEK